MTSAGWLARHAVLKTPWLLKQRTYYRQHITVQMASIEVREGIFLTYRRIAFIEQNAWSAKSLILQSIIRPPMVTKKCGLISRIWGGRIWVLFHNPSWMRRNIVRLILLFLFVCFWLFLTRLNNGCSSLSRGFCLSTEVGFTFI